MLVPIIIGLSVGSIYGLTSMGLVLTYRTSGVFNLAHGAIGMLGTYVFWQLWQDWGIPLLPSLALTLGFAAPVIGILSHLLVFRFVRDKPVAVTLVAGVGLLVAIQGLVGVVWGTIYKELPSLFPYRLYGVTSSFNVSSQQIGTAVVTAAVGVGLLLYLNRTTFGLKVRSVVDNRELAQLTGIDAERVQAVGWALAAIVSTVAGILISPLIQLSSIGLTLVVIQAMAAAVVGGLRSLPLTYAGGLLLGLIESFMAKYLPSNQVAQGLKVSAAFLLLYAAVLAGSFLFRLFRDVSSEAKTGLLGREVEPTRLGPVFVILGLTALLLPFVPSYLAFLITSGVIASIGFQAFVLVTGLGGQVLLSQAAFVGIGAIMYARMVSEWQLPIVVAFIAAPAVAVVLGLAISLPAARLRGLPLALLTLGFGLFMDSFVFVAKAFSGGYSGFTITRPSLLGIDLGDERVFQYTVVAVALAAAILVRNLASGRSGRVLVAVKNAEAAAQAFGTSVQRTKVLLFSLAAALSALSGVFVALQVQAVAAVQFNINQSLLYLAVAILGGVGSAQGAVVGGLLVFLVPEALANLGLTEYQQLLFGAAALALLVAGRGGLSDLIVRQFIPPTAPSVGHAAAGAGERPLIHGPIPPPRPRPSIGHGVAPKRPPVPISASGRGHDQLAEVRR